MSNYAHISPADREALMRVLAEVERGTIVRLCTTNRHGVVTGVVEDKDNKCIRLKVGQSSNPPWLGGDQYYLSYTDIAIPSIEYAFILLPETKCDKYGRSGQ